ncbi:hypothetical protein Tco_0295037 [Tanacetum coccineum]
MPYYPNFQSPFASREEQMLFNQFKMQMQFNQFSQQQQQPPNQATASQPQSDQQSYHLVDETEDDNEDEPISTPMSKKTISGSRLKSKANKNKEKEAQVEAKKRARIVWSQEEELILTKTRLHGAYQEHVDGKVDSNASIQKFNQLVSETLAHSEENDEDWMTRVEILYKTHTNGEFKHKSAWKFLKDKHKLKNPESTLARRNRLRVTDDEPEHFGDDALPRPPGLQRIAKSQRSGSNSPASSGSNPMMYQEFMKEQYELDRKAKMEVIERETQERMRLIHSQRIAENMKVLEIDTRGMDPADAAIINGQKERIRAAYPPPTPN